MDIHQTHALFTLSPLPLHIITYLPLLTHPLLSPLTSTTFRLTSSPTSPFSHHHLHYLPPHIITYLPLLTPSPTLPPSSHHHLHYLTYFPPHIIMYIPLFLAHHKPCTQTHWRRGKNESHYTFCYILPFTVVQHVHHSRTQGIVLARLTQTLTPDSPPPPPWAQVPG